MSSTQITGAVYLLLVSIFTTFGTDDINNNDIRQSEFKVIYEEDFYLIQTVISTFRPIVICNRILELTEDLTNNKFNDIRDEVLTEIKSQARKTKQSYINIRPITKHYDSNRSKRQIEFVGDLWHSISGAPGPHQFKVQEKQFNHAREGPT